MNKKTFSTFLLFTLSLLLVAGDAHSIRVTHVQASTAQQQAMVFAQSGSVLGDEVKDHDSGDKKDNQEKDREEGHKQEKEAEQKATEQKADEQKQELEQEKTEQDSEAEKVELKTYDHAENLLEEKKVDDKGQLETQLGQEIPKVADLQELKIKTKSGEELGISVKEADDQRTTKVHYQVAGQQLKVSNGDHNRELVITPKSDYFEFNDGVKKARVALPLTVDSQTGEVFVKTAVGLVKVGVSPDKALEVLNTQNKDLQVQGDLRLQEGGDGAEYKVTASQKAKLLSLVPVSLTREYAIDAETGAFVGAQQTFMTKILDILSF